MATGLCYVLQLMSQNTGISNFGRNNFKFSKTVAYMTYIVFQCSLSQGYVTLNRGFSGLWVRVCFFHHEVSGGRGMAWLTFFRPCRRVTVHVTLDASVQYSGVFSDSELSPGPMHELATIFLFSSPSVIELSTVDLHQYHKDV